MNSRASTALAPVYLFLCLTLGGSGQGIWTNLVLQWSALAIIAWCAISGAAASDPPARYLRWIGCGSVVLLVLQLVPVPATILSALPGRDPVSEGFTILGLAPPWLPISMAPEKSLSALLSVLPAAAMFALLLRKPVDKPVWLAYAAIAATLVSIFVGVMQLSHGETWYPYRFTSVGAAVGLFANSNHMASLMMSSIPLAAALGATRVRRREGRSPVILALLTMAILIAVAVLLNDSLAILILGGPMVAASLLIFLPPGKIRLGRLALMVAVLIAAGATVLSIVGAGRLSQLSGQASLAERQEIWSSSLAMAETYFPAGSGLGSFPDVYRLQENPKLVDWEYVNHAHSDFLELAIELGLPGMILVALFLLWWGWRFAQIWRSHQSSPLLRAASLVSLGLLLHSLVDFPLRTAGLSALFAMAIAMMAAPRHRISTSNLRQPRHLRLEDLG